MAVLIDGFGFGGGWFHGFATVGCVASGFAVVGLVAAGCKALGLVAVGLAVVRFKQHQVHHTNTAETTSVTKTAECNAAKPNVGKAVGSFMTFLANATINQF